MARSRRHTSICAITTAKSEKQDKRLYNRRYRRTIRLRIRQGLWETLPPLREYSDPCNMDKDGKQWYNRNQFPSYMRK